MERFEAPEYIARTETEVSVVPFMGGGKSEASEKSREHRQQDYQRFAIGRQVEGSQLALRRIRKET